MMVHPTAAKGYTASSEVFVKGRPDYPPEVADWLRGDLALGPGKTVLDLGAGTGKFLPTLRATGASVVAVEPVDAMRARMIEQNPGVDAMAGSAEHIPVTDCSVDAVICAQSFHWFANQRAVIEIHRVLKPGAHLGLIWNVRDERVPWVADLTAIIEPYAYDAPRYHRQDWRLIFPAQGFSSLIEKHFNHHHTGTPEQVIVARALSVSFIAALPLDWQDTIAAQIRSLIARTPELAGKTEVAFPYRTVVFNCHRVS